MWRSLPSNKWLIFLLAIAALIVGLLELPSSLMSPPWHKVPPAKAIEPVVIPPYSVTWDLGFVAYDHRTTLAGMWLRQGRGTKYDALFPANLALHFTIVNRRGYPVLIKNYHVDMRTNQNEFVRLHELPVFGSDFYGGYSSKELSLQDSSTLLQNVVQGSIPAYGTIRGWGLFQYPKDTGVKFLHEIKMTISDYSDANFSVVVKPESETPSNPPGIWVIGQPTDLSKLPIKFVDEMGHEENP